jgi:hypothetical protein
MSFFGYSNATEAYRHADHEAGHVVASVLNRVPVSRATAWTTDGPLAEAICGVPDPTTTRGLQANLEIIVAGEAAEAIFDYPVIPSSTARRLCPRRREAIRTHWRLGPGTVADVEHFFVLCRCCHPTMGEASEEIVLGYFDEIKERVIGKLRPHKRALNTIASALMVLGTIDGDYAERCVRTGGW